MLRETVEDDAGLPKNEAKAVLGAHDQFIEDDAAYALDILQSRGHIYCVDEQVYIMSTDD